MESANIDIKNLTKIPEKEFKQHFRDWMEQDDVARSLQAKLRKDLIVNFNKTSLGKKIILQTGVSHRLNLSPLLLALNTLAAEFLYAQNCHFTLSVFCTEVPYRNTLPDFESARHFRFSEAEMFEILDALASNMDTDTKQSIAKEYSKKNNHSLLFVVIKNLLSKSKGNELQQRPLASQLDPPPPPPIESKTTPQKIHPTHTPTDRPNSKVEHQSKNFRYLNKYLMILSKKMKQMSQNLDVLQKQNQVQVPPQTVKKSLQTRKLENLNRNLEKISENLRSLSVSKRKNKRLSAVVTAVNTMAGQFEKCLLNFDQISKGLKKGGCLSGEPKSYSDWIHEMRTSDNGKLFLEKIESSLRKNLHRERKKLESELEQRMQIQKDILKSKYKQRLAEELAQSTSRAKTDDPQLRNEMFEKKLDEFEAKHKELHLKIQEAERKLLLPSPGATHVGREVPKNQITQTAITPKPSQNLEDAHNELRQMMKNTSEQERQVDHIVFDAKLRVQELEHESNQLDRSFREYLERQRSEKQKMRENATSIWQSYALGKSILDTKGAPHRLTAITTKVNKHPVMTFDRTTPAPAALAIPAINIDDVSSASISPPVFENPFRVAQKKVLSRSKTTLPQSSPPPSPPPTVYLTDDTDSSAEEFTRDKRKQQRPRVLRLIEHKEEDQIRTKKPAPSRSDATATKLTQLKQQLQLSPELNIEDTTLDGTKSSSVRSEDSNNTSSARGVFKLKRQLFTSVTNNEGGGSPSPSPSSTSYAQQMNSNGNKEPKASLPQINKHENGDDDDDKKKPTEGHKKDEAVNREIMVKNVDKNKPGENKALEVSIGASTGVGLVTPLIIAEEDISSQSFHLNTPITGSRVEKDSTNNKCS